MSNLSKSAILEMLNWRYAVKKFDATKKIDAENWNFLLESLRLSASSFGLQPWKFILVQDKALLKKLREQSWDQSQVEDASHFLVFTTLKSIDEKYIHHYVEETAKVRGLTVEALAGYEKSMVGALIHGRKPGTILEWSRRQAYIAMGNLLTSAALVQVDACPMEGLDAEKYDELLGLNSTVYATVAAVALGYRHAEDKNQHAKKVRFPLHQILETR